ncbi:MAG TPA: class I mannose-6-phosphate isomerase [Armatimonadetes bacterium]|jgi:mannose-6-phosphate isomerase|nr:class I mannose-6-phosphate isomerase [Armatimonadota bacterium]
MDVYPLRFSDLFMERVWGGRGLERVLGKLLPPEKRIGESWEVSDQPGAMSAVCNGVYAGLPLSALRERFPEELLGPRGLAMGRGRFPLLIKFLDCEDRLSVQVHPDDAYAGANEGGSLGKTEMWYVVAAEPGAILWCGLKPGIDRLALESAIAEGRVPETLAEVPVSPGDCFFIPAGTVHALGGGLIICEIQQNSDVTYRFYDWDRVGLDGRPRELHIQKSLDVIRYGEDRDPRCPVQEREVPGATVARLVTCPEFAVEKLVVTGLLESDTGGMSFHALTAVMGEGHVRAGEGAPEALRRGETLLIPGAAGRYEIESAGELAVLRAFLP